MASDASLLRPKRDRARVEFDPTVLPARYSSVFSAARIKVLGALVDRLPRHRAAVVSRRDLTQATGLSRRTVENALRLARDWGLIREWQQHPGEDPFVDMDVYDEGDAPVDLHALAGEACWIGVDLGLTGDLSAVVAAFRDGEDGFTVAPQFFCPADNLRARADRDGVPYPTWADQGFIVPTPGNVTDYRAIEAHIRDLCERFDVQEIAFDPAYAQAIMGPLVDDGLPAVIMRQGWVTMAPAVKELDRAIISRRFTHGGHPVLRWCFDNVAIQTDSAGNRTMTKGKSRDRIDGAVACAMAVGRAASHASASVYDDPEWSPEWMVLE